MRQTFTWEGYRKHLEKSLNKGFVDAYYEALFEKEKWELYLFRYKFLVMPILKKIAPQIDHEAFWDKRKEDFTKELILYCWNVSKYRTTHELGYKDEDVEHLVYDILTAEGIKCNFV